MKVSTLTDIANIIKHNKRNYGSKTFVQENLRFAFRDDELEERYLLMLLL